KHYLKTGQELPPMSVSDRVALAKRHYDLSLRLKGDVRGVFEMRRHLSCYFKGLPDFKDTRIKLVTETDPQKVLELLSYIEEKWGSEQIEGSSNVYGV
ncbi:MAG: tRNA dihydrouridine synthase DusB, partial [Bacteroidales bacterium]|nr:tRNA dihydrouridine synthase DusB [Bacteroidales bacterium]